MKTFPSGSEVGPSFQQQANMALTLGEERLNWWAAGRTRETVDVAALVALHGALLFRVAFSVVRSAPEAEDIVQETFLRAWQQGARLSEVDEIRAWLVRVAWNLALDRKRRIVPTQMDEGAAAILASTDLPADRQLASAGELAKVLAAMDRLPRRERAVLMLTAVEELSVAEIAVVLGKSPSGVRSLVFRARAHLQARLDAASRRSGQTAAPRRTR